MQLGFVGLGKMGGNMVHRIHRDSDHQVVAFDFSDEAVKEAEGNGATGVASLDVANSRAVIRIPSAARGGRRGADATISRAARG